MGGCFFTGEAVKKSTPMILVMSNVDPANTKQAEKLRLLMHDIQETKNE